MIRAVLILLTFMFPVAMFPVATSAQGFRALAQVLPEATALRDAGRRVELSLSLSQSVPYRVSLFGGPDRLAIDFREVAWEGLPDGFDASDQVLEVSTGAASGAASWSRMVLRLAQPMEIESAEMRTDETTGEARVLIRLSPGAALVAPLTPPVPLRPELAADDRFVVVLDPGHGGVDPGAEAGGLREADIMLRFALELEERLVRSGVAEVVVTRREDRFVSLPERISIARAAGGDVFLSLHADALAEGAASGATVYTLSDEAGAQVAGALLERFGRSDLIEGVDLGASDDTVAGVLIDLARQETGPRSEALADSLLEALAAADIPLHRQPRMRAGFTVLTAADMPSVLLEVGYLSDAGDRGRLADPDWRAGLQEALVGALEAWRIADTLRR